jgi:hypothetical protein
MGKSWVTSDQVDDSNEMKQLHIKSKTLRLSEVFEIVNNSLTGLEFLTSYS